MKYRKYVIAGITIELPDTLPGGHFARALETFAAGSAAKGADGLPAGSTHPAATTPVPPAATPADTTDPAAGATIADTAPALRLAPGICPPAQADYRELDSFDFADADADCRFGIDAAGYLLEMAPRSGSSPARFRKRFDTPDVTTDFTPLHDPALLRFGLWTMFNLAALRRHSVAFHSSVIAWHGRGVLFLGESGTGKSTHTRLWREHIPGARLLNDDSPIVRILDGEAHVCGSPWSGKTPCYHNVELPIAGIVRLSQAPRNAIRRLRTLEALGALIPSAPPAFARDERLQDRICEIISQLIRHVPVYHLECLPDAEAARLACTTIFPDENLR